MTEFTISVDASDDTVCWVDFYHRKTKTTKRVNFDRSGDSVDLSLDPGSYVVTCNMIGKDGDRMTVSQAIGDADPEAIAEFTLVAGGMGTRDLPGGKLLGYGTNLWTVAA